MKDRYVLIEEDDAAGIEAWWETWLSDLHHDMAEADEEGEDSAREGEKEVA